MKVDRIYLIAGLLWLVGGMLLGEHMGRSQDHGQMPTHAHIMLVGGVLSILWAIINRVWSIGSGLLAWIQLGLHQAGTAVMIYALFHLYGGNPTDQFGMIAGIGAMIVILATVLMLFQAFIAKPAD